GLNYQIRISSSSRSWNSSSFEIVDSIIFKDYPQGEAEITMTYDELNKRILLYNCMKGEMYFLDKGSNNWLGIPTVNNPTSRTECDITYISDHNLVAMFGGNLDRKAFDDFWLFDIDSNTWNEVITDIRPQARTSSSIFYDRLNDQLILHGGLQGLTEANNNYYWGLDTWMYSFSTNSWQSSVWSINRKGPSSIASNAESIYMVVGGGLFKWTDAYWSEITTNGQFEGWEQSFAYIGSANKFILFMGRVSDTYLLDETTLQWEKISTTDKPSTRIPNKLIWDSYASMLLTYGGTEVDMGTNNRGKSLHDLWVFDAFAMNWIPVLRTPVIDGLNEQQTTNDNPFILNWKVVDDKIKSIAVYLDDKEIQSEKFVSGLGGVLSFSTVFDLREGDNIIRIVVEDFDGNIIEELG
ncbi:MAG: kelch repeat-containing protein, partial [Candidatus Heimdallarchaeota archaeon]